MIPKIIHYCWFGRGEMPEEVNAYIQEWKEKQPDWQFMFWNEQNAPMHLLYMQRAHQEKKFANMSNLLRLYALLEYGGIYLDTDIKLIKPLDVLCTNSSFFGFEEGEENSEYFWVNNAICGAEKNHSFIRELYVYLLQTFDGSEQANLSSPRMTTELLRKKRALQQYGHQQLVDVTLYPKEFFYPIHYAEVYKIANLKQYLFPETIAVHVWARTWLSKDSLLYIIDDLYKLNHEQMLKITNQELFTGYSEKDTQFKDEENDHVQQIEMLHQLKRLIAAQYFSKSFIEELIQSLQKITLQLSQKNADIQLSEERQFSFLHENHKLLENIHEANSQIARLELEVGQQSNKADQLRIEIAKQENEKRKLLEEIKNFVQIVENQGQNNNRLVEHISNLLIIKRNLENDLNLLQENTEESEKELLFLKNELVSKQEEFNRIRLELSAVTLIRKTNDENNEREISHLHHEIKRLYEGIKWYADTYENRRLLSIIKDRVVLQFRKLFSGKLTSIVEAWKSKSVVRQSRKRRDRILCTIVNHNNNENAKKLKKTFSDYYKTVVIDSGSTVKERKFINLPNVYYSGLYNYAYNMAIEKGFDYILFICSDVVIKKEEAAKIAYNLAIIDLSKIGVYSPSSDGRSHYQCKKQKESGLRIVEFVEGFIFLANMKMLQKFSPLDTGKNLFGWGIDVVKGYYARKLNLQCVLDDGVSVYHPDDTGYSSKEAEYQMYEWFQNLEDGEQIKQFHMDRVNLIRKGVEKLMKISIIVPCYNQACYLQETVDTIFNQSFSDFEVLIINDGSTDNTEEIASRLAQQYNQIRYIYQENQGLGAARNTGLKNATGNLVQFLDADDLLSMHKFSKAVNMIADNPNIDIVYSGYLCFEDGNPANTWTYSRVQLKDDPIADFITEWEKELSIPVHCFLFRRSIIGDTKFDISLPNHEDWAFHLSIASKKPKYAFDPESTAYYRIKQTAMSQDKVKMKDGKNMCLANAISSGEFSADYMRHIFSRFDYSIAVGIITCKKNIEKMRQIRNTWAKELEAWGIKHYFVIGDPDADKIHLDGDTLYVNCPDNYESLPAKVFLLYEYIYQQTDFEYVFKVDDDCYVNAENIYSTYFWKYDYFGRVVATDEKDLDRTWHFGKCETESLNKNPYQTNYIGPWCGGGFGYFISRKAMAALQEKKEQILAGLYEDKAIGDALREMDILPSENPAYSILNIQQFNINHTSDAEVANLLDHVGKDVFTYKAIIELTNESYYNQISQTKKKYANY